MLAQEEARRLGHNFVGTEQILLGLIGESTGIAAKVLKSMGVNLKDARVEVEKIIGRGSGFVAVEIPFTPRAKRVLELSLEEARQLGKDSTAISQQYARSRAVWQSDVRHHCCCCCQLMLLLLLRTTLCWTNHCCCCRPAAYVGHNYIGTEHILLGLLREGEGVAARVLETLGADPSKIRTQVCCVAVCRARGSSWAGRAVPVLQCLPPLAHPHHAVVELELERGKATSECCAVLCSCWFSCAWCVHP